MNDLLKKAATLLQDKYAKKLKPEEEIRLEVISEADQIILLRALVGTQNRAHEFELKAELKRKDDKEPLTLLLLDFFDASLKEFFRHDRRAGFSLDFSKRRFDQTDIWVRQEFRDFEAERLANELLLSADAEKLSKID